MKANEAADAKASGKFEGRQKRSSEILMQGTYTKTMTIFVCLISSIKEI